MEGVRTAATAQVLAKRAGVEMPIGAQVHAVLFEGVPPRVAVQELLGRPITSERD